MTDISKPLGDITHEYVMAEDARTTLLIDAVKAGRLLTVEEVEPFTRRCDAARRAYVAALREAGLSVPHGLDR